MSYPPSENLVDGRRLLQRALRHDLGPHLLHVEHERVQRLLDVRLLGLLARAATAFRRETRRSRSASRPAGSEERAASPR